MRFIPVNCVQEGSILSNTIYGKNGEIWLTKGTVLNSHYVEKLNILKIIGIYIQDDETKEIEAKDVISEKIRATAVKVVKHVFIHAPSAKSVEEDTKILHEVIEDIIDDIINNRGIMVNMIDLKFFDDYTFHHSVNVAVLSIMMGISLRLPKQTLYDLGISAILHDIGKVFIEKKIIDKSDPLTVEELELIKRHAALGYVYLKEKFKLREKLCLGALHHHEKYDGTGYPYGLKGDDISLFGRIIGIADVYDALTSDRPYRKALLPSEAIEFIMSNGGISFDINLVEVFIRKIAPYPSGTLVKLSDGKEGYVVRNNELCTMRPLVKIINDGTQKVEPYYLDLTNDYSTYSITITEVLSR
ncbi:HD-GYP domain-containing protein [Candidatus Formimonas warabiya]|uniref:HD-GYP domain-containing protein n=1 Tax=Formimonas warabiya TaxID=1761012 RepID=A0A3G1KN63_FORW1|nr:HD-GYP domain-containing protein [Candidatus Formimonas warabiya]ATW23897.1 hypothetical protein DCMF_02990 [Candidatus Formimonas warabiya]